MTNPADGTYEALLRHVFEMGTPKTDRTGTGTYSVFGTQIRFDLAQGFPLVTTKKIPLRWVAEELFWFLRGESNVTSLQAAGVDIWDEWADEEGELGPIYGVQWRSWANPASGNIDQISDVIEQIKSKPDSRRLLVTAWNPAEVDKAALPPCHVLFQFYVADGKLSCQLYQRSADMFLGVPFNIASYSLLTMMIAHQCDLELGEFIWTGGDTHVYTNHFEAVDEQLSRAPLPMPTVRFKRKPESIFDYTWSDIELVDYRHHPSIAAPVAV